MYKHTKDSNVLTLVNSTCGNETGKYDLCSKPIIFWTQYKIKISNHVVKYNQIFIACTCIKLIVSNQLLNVLFFHRSVSVSKYL